MAALNVTIPALKLNDGASIPMLGYGVGTAWGKREIGTIDQAIIDGVKTAVKLGFYHLDGAECKFCMYSHSGTILLKIGPFPLTRWLQSRHGDRFHSC
jgi:hypothetical protein